MDGIHHRHRHIAQIERPALAHAHRVDPATGRENLGQFVNANHGDLEFGSERRSFRGMVAMAVRQKDVSRAFDGLGPAAFRKDRVPVEPRIDQQDLTADFQSKSRVTEPGKLHEFFLHPC